MCLIRGSLVEEEIRENETGSDKEVKPKRGRGHKMRSIVHFESSNENPDTQTQFSILATSHEYLK